MRASVDGAQRRRDASGTRGQPSLGLLLSPAFILCLAIMLLNDQVLKHAYPGFITGKLSDVTGIFIFYLFFLSFLSRFRLTTGVLIGVAFTIWKTACSNAFLHWINAHGSICLYRTVDPTDLWALGMLPLAWWYAGWFTPSRPQVIGECLLLVICPLIFMGQGVRRPYTKTIDTYRVDVPAEELVARLLACPEVKIRFFRGDAGYYVGLSDYQKQVTVNVHMSINRRPFDSCLIVRSLDDSYQTAIFADEIFPRLHCTYRLLDHVQSRALPEEPSPHETFQPPVRRSYAPGPVLPYDP